MLSAVEIIPVLLSTMIEAFSSCKMQKLSNFNSFCISVHKLYVQVTESMTSEDVRKRELIRETKSALGGTRRQAFDKTGEHYELQALTLFRPM